MSAWILSSTVLILAVAALRRLLRGRISLRVQYALWLLVALRLLLPVNLGESALSVENAADALRTEIALRQEPPLTTEMPSGETVDVPVTPVTPVTPAVPATPVTPVEPAVSVDWAALARTVWLTGAAVLALVFLAVNLRFGLRLRRSRQRVTEETAALPVYVSAAAETPCLFGLLRPAIYLTPAACEDAETRRCAIAHELTHYRHGDQLWSVLRCLCLALHWYHPLVWWAVELSRRDAELACDEATVGALGERERAAYGRILIRLTCEKRPALLTAATTMTDNGRQLRERITTLVKRPKTVAAAAVVLTAALALVTVATFTGGEGDPEEPLGTTYEADRQLFAQEFGADFTAKTMPTLCTAENSFTLIDAWGSAYTYAAPKERALTEENFDRLFPAQTTADGGWTDGQSAAKLRRNNLRSWRAEAVEPADGLPNRLYLLQQRDGTCYLALGYDAEELHTICWVLHLTPTEAAEAEIHGTALSKLRTDAERYTVPEGVTNIVTFSCRDLPNLREITLPEGLKEIGNCAFQNCTALERIELPTTVAKLGVDAFGRCTALQTAELGDCAVWQLSDTVFARCTALTDVTLPPKIQSIGQRTFYQCRSLRSVTVPDGVKSIGEEAFAECASLETITLPAVLESIGAQAFAGCTSLREIVIPDGVTGLPRWVFADCENLERVTIPSSVRAIRSLAFQHCDRLTIVCEPGSAAEAYAKKNGIPTELMEYDAFRAALTLAAGGGAATLRFDAAASAVYPAAAASNTVALNELTFVPAEAQAADARTLLLELTNGHQLAFYEDSNRVAHFAGGVCLGTYEARGVGIRDPRQSLYRRMCSWYTEAQFAEMERALRPIPDQGQDWRTAAQAFMDAKAGLHLSALPGGKFCYTWVSCGIEAAEKTTEAFRAEGRIDENTWCFYATLRFVPENDEARDWSMAGNTTACTDPDAPKGAWECLCCCTIRKGADGWHGEIWGTGW